ncbi:MAG: hypothetical protein NZ529_11150, partial [Cytophagaceae bacterium]|nr:hypothetical protein [Cytophagaceae bacterium]MDW8457340.1 hypothetical protein [Cytophagaceae bacterium]
GALAEHRSDSGVADSPAPQGRALHEEMFYQAFLLMRNIGSMVMNYLEDFVTHKLCPKNR